MWEATGCSGVNKGNNRRWSWRGNWAGGDEGGKSQKCRWVQDARADRAQRK